MKNIYILEELDCAHCAKKIEDQVNQLEGVTQCTLNFLTQKMTIEVVDEKADEIEKAMKKIVNKLEPDVEVVKK